MEGINEYDNVAYYFDIDAIIDYILNGESESDESTEETEMYSIDDKTNALTCVNKQLIKSNKNDSNSAIKYDLIKNFIGYLSDWEASMNSFQITIFNAMINKGFIKKG